MAWLWIPLKGSLFYSPLFLNGGISSFHKISPRSIGNMTQTTTPTLAILGGTGSAGPEVVS